jgi:hypothetical protein
MTATKSPIAIQAAKQWDAGDRPHDWIPVYGAVVHTTGGGLPLKAEKDGIDPLVLGSRVYNNSHGCHYLIGWSGLAGGLLQLADDAEQASGVGVRKDEPEKNQWTSVQRGKGAWEKDLPRALVERWRARWPGYANPLDLLPGTKSANAPYLHIEMIPCVYGGHPDAFGTPVPFAAGQRFTAAQYLALGYLLVDIAKRHRWPDRWWATPRLLGHEDLTPLSRHDKNGGWDPGFLRAKPYFEWHVLATYLAIAMGDVGPLHSQLERECAIKDPRDPKRGGHYKGL